MSAQSTNKTTLTAAQIRSLCDQLGLSGQERAGELWCRNPLRDDSAAGSFSINLETGLTYDFATGEGGHVAKLAAQVWGCRVREALERAGIHQTDGESAPVGRKPGAVQIPPPPEAVDEVSISHPSLGDPTTVYRYRGLDGRTLGYVCRWDHDGSKTFRQRFWVPGKGWSWQGPGSNKPLYGLHKLGQLQGAPVLIVEGEKAAVAAQRALGDRCVVLAWCGGAGAAHQVDCSPLAFCDVTIWPDDDDPGRTAAGHIERLATRAGAAQVRVVQTPGRDDGWDLADAVDDGWGPDRILAEMAARTGQVQATARELTRPALGLQDPVDVWSWPYRSDRERPLYCIENVQHLLIQYGISARYDEISKRVEIEIPGAGYSCDNKENASLARINSLARRNGLPGGVGDIADAILEIADAQRVNPVRDWIRGTPWDGVKRFETLVETLVLQERADPDVCRLLLRRWLISAVRMLDNDGTLEAHGVLVLQGAQGAGKGRWLSRLVPDGRWLLAGAKLDPSNKDSVLTAVGHWIVELGELDATFRRADIAELKAFLTKPRDQIRRPFGRGDSHYPRRTVFAGSVNPASFLADPTGNRRFWTLAVVRCDYEHDIDVQQLWAEVATWCDAGEPHWLTAEEIEQLAASNAAHEQESTIRDRILACWDWTSHARPERLSASEVLALIGYDRPGRGDTVEAAQHLRELCGEPTRGTKGRRQYSLPPWVPGSDRDWRRG